MARVTPILSPGDSSGVRKRSPSFDHEEAHQRFFVIATHAVFIYGPAGLSDTFTGKTCKLTDPPRAEKMIENLLQVHVPTIRNAASTDADSFDERSDDKGPEPEGLAITEIDGRSVSRNRPATRPSPAPFALVLLL